MFFIFRLFFFVFALTFRLGIVCALAGVLFYYSALGLEKAQNFADNFSMQEFAYSAETALWNEYERIKEQGVEKRFEHFGNLLATTAHSALGSSSAAIREKANSMPVANAGDAFRSQVSFGFKRVKHYAKENIPSPYRF